MPQVSMHRKAIRPLVLAKRTQYLRKYYRERSYKPLYEKLKNNNSYLAKALSQEKQNCQSFFSQNIALIAELQELRLTCTTQDNVIANIVNNFNEILKILVNLNGYVTNTISIYQKFASSNANLKQTSMTSAQNEAVRRMSTKSPARGIVKPMISGHTIRNPTINLSRVNMEHINNATRLSDIQEESTPRRSQEVNEARSPISVSIPITQLQRYETEHTYRLPERLTVSPRKVNNAVATNADQRRRRKSRHHSERVSGSYSRSNTYLRRSNRWSGETSQNRAENRSYLNSATVQLSDVSKLLQNSQTINIRTLSNSNIDDIERQESSDNAPHDTSNRDVIIPKTPIAVKSYNENETYVQEATSSDTQTRRKISERDSNRKSNVADKSRLSQNNADWEDPLEGPSWLLDSEPLHIESRRTDISNVNTPVSQNISKVSTYSNEWSDLEDVEEESPTNLIDMQNFRENSLSIDRQIKDEPSNSNTADDSYCEILSTSKSNRNSDDTENLASFVTIRRGQSATEEEEETEDFTLMLKRRSMRNMNFDINELRLPALEESIINPTNISNNIDDEVTTTIQRITDFQMPSISHQSMHETDKTTTTDVPMVKIHLDNAFMSDDAWYSSEMNKNLKTQNPIDNETHTKSSATINKKAKRKKKCMNNNRNPAAATVLLEKLNESSIKLRTSMHSAEFSNIHDMENGVTNQEDNLDLESNDRPKRRKAPMNLKEPSLNKKLRRSR